MKINFILNENSYEKDINPKMRLLDFLRDEMKLTGTKEGCGEGECGACTIIFENRIANSCLMLTGQIKNKTLYTIEGLKKNGEYDIIQKMFIKNGAVQCGYCTPGMIMATKGLLLENPNPSTEEIKKAISGNLCRCTGYVNIIKAIEESRDSLKEEKCIK